MEHDLLRLEHITVQNNLNTLQRELKQRVQALFFDDLRLEQTLDEKIATRMNPINYTNEVKCRFVIRVEGQ